MNTLGYIFLGMLLYILSWIWATAVITFACNSWWRTRERYRKQMDDKVSDLFDEKVGKFN
jgi:threonine/homoserine/homoserine lactone efflux protein